MLSVNLPENAVPGYLRSLNHPGMEQGLSIACINSPSNVTLSGKEELIDALKKQLDVDGIFARTVRTGLAYHSSAMRPIALEYQDAIGSLMPDENGLSAIPMISSVTGQPVRASTLRTPEYWVDNMVNPVKFLHSMQRLLQGSTAAKMGMARLPTIRHLVEIGPHSALSRPSQDIIAEMALRRDIRYLSVLSRFKSSLSTALELAGELFTYGYPVNIDAVNRDLESTAPAFLTDTPEYPFDHSQRYWYEPRISSDFRLRDAAQNDLLGTPSIDYNPLEPRWRKFLSTESTSWIADHVVSDVAVYPGAGMLVMAMEAVKQVAQKGRQIAGFFIKEADFSRAMVVRSGLEGRVESNVHLRFLQRPFEKESTASEVRISVRYNDGGWAECCRTMIQVVYENRKTEVDGGFETRYATEKTLNDFESATKACQQRIDREDFYKYHANHGIRWGPSFQQLEDMYWDGFETAISQVQVSDTEFHRTSIVHPAVLDAMYQMTWIGPTRGLSQTIPTEIPRKIWDMWVSATGWSYNSTDRIRVMTQSRFKPGSRGLDASTYAVSANGTLLLSMARTQLAPAASDSALARAQKQLCYSIDWKPQLSLLDSQQLSELCRAHEIDRDEEILVHFVQQLTLAISATMRNTLEELEKTGRRPSSTHLQKYVEWMRYQLNRVPAGELAGVNHVDTLDSSEDLLQDLIQKLGSSVSGWQMMITVARNLSGILQGDIDPLAILFETNLAESFYGIAFKGVCDRRFETFMDLASHEKPELRILEVGAGTGMMTSHVISALQNLEREKGGARFAEYVYTDISPAFFEKAREKFVDVQDRLVFKTLDLERDVIEQGFEAESYDLVIAGNVIHATTSIQSSLENIRKALKPGGKLVMVEVTEPDRLYIPFGFGILRGWWLSTEKYRSWSPCITEEQWNSVLKTSGFSGNAMTLGDHQSDSCHFSSLIVSTVPMETRNSQNQEIAVVVKSNNHSQRQTDLARFLQEDLAYKAGYHVAVSSLSEAPSTVISQAEVVLFIPEIDGSILKDLSEADFTSLQTLSASAKRMIWVTSADIRSPSYPESGAASGLTRTLRSERANQQLTSLVLEGENHDLRKCSEDIVKVLAASSDQSSTEKEVEYVVRDGQIMTARIIEESAIESDFQSTMYPQSRQEQLDPNRPLTLSIGTPGSLDTLQFIEDPIPSRDLGPDEVEIDAKSWGMNFRDILVALGRLEEDTFGFEAAGYISRVGSNCTKFQPGDRVIMVNVGCMRMYPRCDQRLAIKLPDSISFEDAASAAGVGITAYHSLIKVARLQKGDRVLIHSGSGGTGQMAIRVAQMVGAEVFTTVGYDEKKKLLVDQLQVPEDHVLYSRDTSFAQAIKRMTNGHGVDVVLNSLSGDSLVASWECIAPYGRFIEIGKADIYANSTLPMSMFALNVSFAAVDFVHLSQTGQDTVHTVLTEFFDLLANGTILPPFPIQTYPLSKVEDAFRLMQSGKNSGRIVVTSQPADVVPTFGVAHRSWKFDSNATYLIAGGTGGLGRSAAKWMVSKGAKNLLLLSRSGSSSAAASKLMTQLRGQGVNVEAPSCDVASRESVQLVLQKYATSLPPIKGCLNASMVLQNALFEKMTHSQWDIAVRSKINTSWNLHTLLPNDLDFFIMLSSLSGIVGAIGQSNYGAGNTYQDALARYRTSHGQTALSMDLGLMGDIGIVAETEEYSRKRGLLVNMTEVEEQEYLNLLDIYCNPNLGVLPPEKSQILVGVMTPAKHQAQGTEVPDMLMRRLFSGFSTMNSLANHASSSDTVDAAAMFRRAGSVEERTEVVTALLAQKLARSLSIPAEDVNPNKPLFEYGVDSLIAVELRNWISKEFAADISVFDLMGGMKIAAVADFVATKANLGKGAGAR
ncbi:MAG: polyketide synthase [Bogoriella megaspora]|nr:MAG: polyketide synthase [Bogoriella megaspora]